MRTHEEKVIRKLLSACRAAEKKLRGTNIMGEEIEAKTLAKLRSAIKSGKTWLG